MIGKGGMGAVYAGVQLDLGRPVAIKTLFEAAVERDRERFGAEALAAASLTHPNIVQVTDSVAAKDGLPPFIVMELLRGTSLSKWIEQRGALSVPTTIDVLLQMLSALEAAHGARILHRDIKPANVVVLDGDDEVRPWIKLIDFGIAKIADYATSATTTGTILGTPSYIAPEIIAGARATTESDLYAVGLCAFEMLAGRKAFSSAHGVDVFVKILQDPTPDLLGQARVPRGLAEVVAKAMHRDPSQRFHSAREMAEALRGSGRERPRERERERARPRERPRGRGRGLFVGAFFLAVVLLAAAGRARARQADAPRGRTRLSCAMQMSMLRCRSPPPRSMRRPPTTSRGRRAPNRRPLPADASARRRSGSAVANTTCCARPRSRTRADARGAASTS